MLKVQKKILIVSQAFFPENSPRSLRTTELVKEFARTGHNVTIITPRIESSHGAFEKEYGVEIKNMGNYSWKSITIKGKGIEMLLRRLVFRFSNLLFEYPSIQLLWLVKKVLKIESGYDLMISVAVPYPVHWGVAAVRTKANPIASVWIADCGDPYMGLETDTFKKVFYFSYLDRSFLKGADYVAVPIKEAINAYYKEFHYKFRVIPQGFTFPAIINSSKDKKRPVFIYSGNVTSYTHYALPFFRYLVTLDIDFEFKIFTTTPEIFTDSLGAIQDKLTIKEYVDRAVLIQEFADADFLLHFPYEKNTQRSLKLIDYWYSERPVLHFDNTENARQLLVEFLHLNFIHAVPNPSIDDYRIEHVCEQFLALSSNTPGN